MRRIVLLITPVSSIGLSGCTWESVRKSFLSSAYGAYGDRYSDFNNRYDEQAKAAAEYYQQNP